MIVSKWFETLDKPVWEEYKSCYQDLRQQGKLDVLDQGDDGCFTSQALLINYSVGPHKDENDVKHGWVATNCWGQFEGGLAVFPDLAVSLKQEAGDLVFSRSAVLVHWVTPVTQGQRFGSTRFTKQFVLRPCKPEWYCPEVDCPKGYMHKPELKQHMRKKHGIDAKRAEIILVERAKQPKGCEEM